MKFKMKVGDMTIKASKNSGIPSRIVVALALAVIILSPVQAQSAEMAPGQSMTEGKMMENCQEMKAEHQKMMEEMKAQDAELTEQVAKMNSASGDQKIGLMAGILTRMVEQRSAMTGRMEAMKAKMMKHMMQHMEMGKESMAKCPMMGEMKGMKNMGEKS
jgi:hypothetical protein